MSVLSLQHRRRLAALVMALSISGFSGCTATSGGGASPEVVTPGPSQASSSTPVDPDDVTFGADCPNLPDTGAGSFAELADQDWLTAISSIPALSQLSVTTTVAELRDDLASQHDVTVFAPTSSAFLNLGVRRGRQLLTNPSEAGEVLRYHVVPGRIAPADLAGEHPTLTGQSLTVTGAGESFTVNERANIICGNIQTANATLYLVDQVLDPS